MRIYMLLVDAPRAPFPPCETGRSSQSADLPDSPGAADSAATGGSQVPSQGSRPTETVPSLERFRATNVLCKEWMAAGSGDLHGGLQVVLLLTFSCWARPASASGGRLGRANTIRSGQEALRVQQGKGSLTKNRSLAGGSRRRRACLFGANVSREAGEGGSGVEVWGLGKAS